MSKDIKAAFRIYDQTNKLYGLMYSDPPVNISHPESINVKLLGKRDQDACGHGEYCPSIMRIKS